jgi:hypothetical protein
MNQQQRSFFTKVGSKPITSSMKSKESNKVSTFYQIQASKQQPTL